MRYSDKFRKIARTTENVYEKIRKNIRAFKNGNIVRRVPVRRASAIQTHACRRKRRLAFHRRNRAGYSAQRRLYRFRRAQRIFLRLPRKRFFIFRRRLRFGRFLYRRLLYSRLRLGCRRRSAECGKRKIRVRRAPAPFVRRGGGSARRPRRNVSVYRIRAGDAPRACRIRRKTVGKAAEKRRATTEIGAEKLSFTLPRAERERKPDCHRRGRGISVRRDCRTARHMQNLRHGKPRLRADRAGVRGERRRCGC